MTRGLLLFLLAEAILASNVLILYASDQKNSTGQIAGAIADGASEVAGTSVRCMQITNANYKRDVYEWADAVIIGSAVINGNADSSVLEFINSFDFEDDLSAKVCSSFSTGGGAAAGLQPVLEQINRGLMTFGLILSGGGSWQNGEGSGFVIPADGVDNAAITLASQQGGRLAKLASVVGQLAPTPAPLPADHSPPPFGTNWTATVSANMTQVGYDAGMVEVNFTSSCGEVPQQQKAKTVYGDFYTVLMRCDLGREFTIAPASRGGACQSRVIGRDTDSRICGACSCPFCVRDTNGTYTHGELSNSKTVWSAPERRIINGVEVDVWSGRAVSTSDVAGNNFALGTTVAFSPDHTTPVYVNVTHPLWIQTSATVTGFSSSVRDSDFDIPAICQ